MTRPIYHSDRYVADPALPRYMCPHCGKLLNADAYQALTGRAPTGRRWWRTPPGYWGKP